MADLTIIDAKKQLELSRPSLEKMNINKLSFEREIEFAVQAFENNPFLLKTQGIGNVLKNIVLSGLSLNPILKYAYLVPRKVKGQMNCCLDPSYMGLCKILTDTGSVVGISATIVYEQEINSLEIQQGMGGFARHKPYFGSKQPGKPIACYSIAVLPNGMQHIELLRPWEWENIKSRSESVKSYEAKKAKGEYAAIPTWETDPEEMIRKTCLKKHYKYLPKTEKSILAAEAIDLDNQINGIEFQNENTPPANTPPAGANAPTYAMATDEDRNNFIKLIDTPGLGEKVFDGKRDKAKFKADKLALYEAGQWPKHEYEAIIVHLQKDIDAIEPASQADPMEDEANTPAPTTEAAAPVANAPETAPEAAAQPPVKNDFE